MLPDPEHSAAIVNTAVMRRQSVIHKGLKPMQAVPSEGPQCTFAFLGVDGALQPVVLTERSMHAARIDRSTDRFDVEVRKAGFRTAEPSPPKQEMRRSYARCAPEPAVGHPRRADQQASQCLTRALERVPIITLTATAETAAECRTREPRRPEWRMRATARE